MIVAYRKQNSHGPLIYEMCPLKNKIMLKPRLTTNKSDFVCRKKNNVGLNKHK